MDKMQVLDVLKDDFKSLFPDANITIMDIVVQKSNTETLFIDIDIFGKKMLQFVNNVCPSDGVRVSIDIASRSKLDLLDVIDTIENYLQNSKYIITNVVKTSVYYNLNRTNMYSTNISYNFML
jgi:hypothetical protein